MQTAPPLPHFDEQALRADVRQFLADERARGTLPRYGHAWTHHDRAFSRRCATHGYVAMTWPRAHGGYARSAAERFVVCEELLAAGAPLGAHWIADRQTGPQILRHGREAVQRAVLPGIAAGEITCAIGMSEPDAGSDLAAVRTRAEKVAGGWRLDGRKIWTTNAQNADYIVVLCRTDPPEGKARQAGLSQLVVDMRAAGVSVRPLMTLPGTREFNEVLFDAVFVPDDWLLGERGAGWRLVTEELAFERSGPDRYLSSFGVLRAALDALGPAPDRGMARAIGRIVARLAAVRALSVEIAGLLDAGASPRTEASMMKELGTTLEQDIVELAREAIALRPGRGTGAIGEALATAILSAPSFSLRGGTREILQGIVARELLR
ncbi:acyl-CoA dehydrogenase family protein [Novosphingobium album (ex Liu et al. 2023)]|uniref:Acyl-CoA dehydrogenase family protein n=1 Tax=Novosphingobium album (ex Liu et al. 2023) TaxID=3031130 RepID=A0ABT5WXA6_9SPHN|nr:acyl-CoA dehydrogenase family protein [Novosphingobium album (ex Liu et al. 2023)]MDE8654512.1 acyl-CoA dehydrogenase family protein [Novosphingobium album (ex Liu et al. 2023)]